jgi:hypothetical protein
MTMFIQLVDGQPVGNAVTEDNFRMLFPGTVFPSVFVSEDVEPLGFGIYDFSNQPDLATFEKVVEVPPVKDDYGRWRQTWVVEPMSAEEVAARTAQEWGTVRMQRNHKLMMSDWTQLPDALTDAATWAVYRQELRDITEQADPFNIVWPALPSAGNG